MADHQYQQGQSYGAHDASRGLVEDGAGGAPGASARAQSAEAHTLLGPVQADAEGELSAESVKQNAARGFSGQSGQLPYLDVIQNSFGRHAISSVRAFWGGQAAAANQAMGARAYTSGDKIAFGGAPDLHTAAHEAAHVVQQRAGVSLSGGVGCSGDAYERHADNVADAVISGRSAESLLDRTAAMSTKSGAEAVQRKEEADKEPEPEDPNEGREVWVQRSVLGFAYHHAGVHVGDDQVVNVTAEPLQAMKDLVKGEPIVKVRKTSFADFKGGDPVSPGRAPQKWSRGDASIRAQSLVGLPWSYDPLDKNCQHFSSEMVSGSAVSPEANSIKAAFEAVLEKIAGAGDAIAGGAKKVGGWIAKTGKKLGAKFKGLFS